MSTIGDSAESRGSAASARSVLGQGVARLLGRDMHGRSGLRALGPRLARGAFWSLAGSVASRAGGLIAGMLVARVLGLTDYGKLGMVLSTVGLFGNLAGFGLGLMASKHVAEFRTTDPERAGRIITLSEGFALFSGLLMALALMLAAPTLANNSLASPEMTGPLRLSALSLLLNAIVGAQSGALAGLEAFRAIARINILAGLANAPLMVGGALLGGLNGAIWGLALSAAVNCGLNYLTLMPMLRDCGIPFPVRGALREQSMLWQFSMPATIGSLLVAPVSWYCNTLLTKLPNGYAEVALVSAANQWRTAILFLPATVGTAFLPILSNVVADRNWSAFRKTASYTIVFSLLAGGLVAAPLFFCADLILRGYGDSFIAGGLVLKLTVIAATIYAVNNQVGRVLASLGRMWMVALFDLVWAVVFLLAGVALIPTSSSKGFAVALVISGVVQCCAQAWYASRIWPSVDTGAAVLPSAESDSVVGTPGAAAV